MRIRRLRSEESGVALITAVVGTAILAIIVTGALRYAVQTNTASKNDQDWLAAFSATEAAVDDYVGRLNADNAYQGYTAANPPPEPNAALTGGWSDVPGGTGQFRYTVDNSRFLTEGAVVLTATGRVGDRSRTVEATLRRRGFLDYLYFTDLETKDPASYNTSSGDPFTPADAQVNCAKYHYAGRDSRCVDIHFAVRDVINGPLHTNDSMLISGSPRFLGDTTTSWQNAPAPGYRQGSSPSPTFARAGDPAYNVRLEMPPTNSEIKAETDPALGGTGCLFTGPTRITLKSSGLMDVTSPFTTAGGNCTPGTNRPLPTNGVIYVRNVPATQTTSCSSHPLGYPVSGDVTRYGCRDGDAFVSGTLDGRLTIGAENNIVVVGHTRYAGGTAGDDMLGLVANSYVQVYHPVNSSGSNINPVTNMTIHAAILSLQHSFTVQNYWRGSPLGTLTVAGVIAQRYRGPVGTFSSSTNSVNHGYEKNYVYDTRMKFQAPPHFLDPLKSAWEAKSFSEVAPKS